MATAIESIFDLCEDEDVMVRAYLHIIHKSSEALILMLLLRDIMIKFDLNI